jgi:hypothetical protein
LRLATRIRRKRYCPASPTERCRQDRTLRRHSPSWTYTIPSVAPIASTRRPKVGERSIPSAIAARIHGLSERTRESVAAGCAAAAVLFAQNTRKARAAWIRTSPVARPMCRLAAGPCH